MLGFSLVAVVSHSLPLLNWPTRGSLFSVCGSPTAMALALGRGACWAQVRVTFGDRYTLSVLLPFADGYSGKSKLTAT